MAVKVLDWHQEQQHEVQQTRSAVFKEALGKLQGSSQSSKDREGKVGGKLQLAAAVQDATGAEAAGVQGNVVVGDEGCSKGLGAAEDRSATQVEVIVVSTDDEEDEMARGVQQGVEGQHAGRGVRKDTAKRRSLRLQQVLEQEKQERRPQQGKRKQRGAEQQEELGHSNDTEDCQDGIRLQEQLLQQWEVKKQKQQRRQGKGRGSTQGREKAGLQGQQQQQQEQSAQEQGQQQQQQVYVQQQQKKQDMIVEPPLLANVLSESKQQHLSSLRNQNRSWQEGQNLTGREQQPQVIKRANESGSTQQQQEKRMVMLKQQQEVGRQQECASCSTVDQQQSGLGQQLQTTSQVGCPVNLAGLPKQGSDEGVTGPGECSGIARQEIDDIDAWGEDDCADVSGEESDGVDMDMLWALPAVEEE
jgi:hypothetical protein